MSSSTVPERPTRVTVYNKDALQELLSPAEGDLGAFTSTFSGSATVNSMRRSTSTTKPRRSRGAVRITASRLEGGPSQRRSSVRSTSSMMDALVNSVVTYDPNDSPTRARKRQRHAARMREQMEEITKAMETVKKNKQRRAEERAERNRQALEHGKDVEAVVVMKVTQHLEERAQRRKETYDKWTENVFDPINNAVQSAVNARTAEEISKDRCAEYERYLDATNKRDLFTDIVSNDYDPYRLHKHRPKPRVPRLLDPLKRQIHTKLEEDALMVDNQAGAGDRPEDDGYGATGGITQTRRQTLRHSRSAAAGVRSGGIVRSKSAATALGRSASATGARAPALRGSRSAAVLHGGGGSAMGRRVGSAAASPASRGAPRTAGGGVRPTLPNGPGFGVSPTNLMGRTGGKWTLPVSTWGKGKLEAHSAACTVKTRMAGGIFDEGESLEEWRVKSMKTFKAGREKMLPSQFSRHSEGRQYNLWSTELPRPKRTFVPWHHGDILASTVPGQTHKDVDPDIKRI